jgi:hypothetical protein
MYLTIWSKNSESVKVKNLRSIISMLFSDTRLYVLS